MRALHDPYRSVSFRPPSWPEDPLGTAIRAARLFVIIWSSLRLGLCAVRGLEFEGLLAAVILGLVLSLRTRSLIP